MREISSNILDIVQNSLRAGADRIEISVEENTERDVFAFTVSDNGCGMDGELLKRASDPFFTTRKSRGVGLGLSLLRSDARAAGGDIEIKSRENGGTFVKAWFVRSHINRRPLGDIAAVAACLAAANPKTEFIYRHTYNNKSFSAATLHGCGFTELREYIGAKLSEIYGGVEKLKNIAELEAIKENVFRGISLRREDENRIRIVVGMATCGIAAGARPVMTAFLETLDKNKTERAVVEQMGCIGKCSLEPIVEVFVPGQDKVTYVHMTPEKAEKVVAEHIIGGKPVKEFTAGADEN